jgi:hypothetical protein
VRLLPWVGVLLCLPAYGQASNADRVVGGGPAPEPRVSLSPTSHEHTPIPLGMRDTLRVQVSNPGTVPARIDSVRLSNDQFRAFPDTFTVAPGASATLLVVHVPTRLGPIAGGVTVHVAGRTDSSVVRLSGFGAAGGMAASTTSIDMGNVTFGSAESRPLALTNASGVPVEVTRIRSGDAQFTADRDRFTIDPGQTVPVTVRFDATSLGTKRTTLTIHHEADLDPIVVDLRADATVSIAKKSLSYGRIAVGETALLPVRIDNPSAAPVTITSITSDNPRFVPDCTTCVIPPGGSQEILVAFTPRDTQVARATLAITHNPTIFVGVVANDGPRNAAGGTDASGKSLPTVQIPFGGELLGALLCLLYMLRRRRLA